MIKNIGPKKWQVIIEGKNRDGGRSRHKKIINGTQQDAIRYEQEKSQQKDRAGGILEPSKITVKEFLKKWVDEVKSQQIKESSLRVYRSLIKNHINPNIGHIPVSKLNAVQIQSFYNDMRQETTADNVRYAHTILTGAMKHAIKWNLTLYNPTESAVLPKVDSKEPTEWMSKEEAQTFHKAIKGHQCETLFKMLLFTGMRPGEALALTWDNLNIDRKTITIVHTLARREGGEWELTTPKTKASKRTLPLSDDLVKSLKIHQKEQELAKGIGYYSGHHFIFATPSGAPLNHKKDVRKEYKKILAEAGIRELSVYALRHTCATLLLEAGVDVKTVSERLGHADIITTLNKYVHVTEGMQQKATDLMAKILRM
ncbi:MAG: site-specific integrase [Bacillota bacterium]|nr:site-specific integrase [Bacillota bacterium]MDW7677700.1 site-specific integrase [Bacillota bacterium]